MVSNDDLFYDPDEDDENQVRSVEFQKVTGTHSEDVQFQKYVDSIRDSYRSKMDVRGQGKGAPRKAANSDAVLNCPGCFCLLCLDCQRHQLYENQYRAMFVVNCHVVEGERLRFPLSKSAKKNRRKEEQQEDDELYQPVRCDHCSTEVAVYDKDEVYHFFNVMAGH